MFVTDFDGTMTKYDFFDLARRDLPTAADHDHWEDYVAGRITHFEALARIFSSIRTDWTGIEAVLDRMELDPALPDAVARLQKAGWVIVVASAGCSWYIHRLLKRVGVTLDVHSNPGVFTPESGLVLSQPVESPYFRDETGIDKPALVRSALQADPDTVFAGDGRPDREPADLVKPQRRFARGWLAEHYRERGESFHRFDVWSEIAERLLEES
ncbi:MAG TPA: HAD-IB family phosphatase [Kiritimatiellia bacterium]|nr:HAD-IB family phosphatase [Kiritimatiellia bacterium]